MIKNLPLQLELPYSLPWLFTYFNIWSESARAVHFSLDTCRKLPLPLPHFPSSSSSSMKCRSAVRSSQGAIYERPPVQGSLAAINIAILRQLTSSTCSRLINGLFSRCRPDETRQDKSSLGGNKSFIYVKFCNICGGPNELPASLSPSLPHCGRVSTLSGITISRPISLSLPSP